VLSPSSPVAAAASLPPAPPPRPPLGVVLGAAGGLGLASARSYPATSTTGGIAAFASLRAGLPVVDHAVISLRLDAAFLNGATVADGTLEAAIFPGTARYLMIFADGGIRIPTGVATAPGATGVGRLGVGWERWRLGPTVVGPFLCGQVARGGGEADAAVLAGLGASLYPAAPAR
jgi:hypothetical protein